MNKKQVSVVQYSKKDLIRLLETIAVYLELKGENPFKINAFRKAARSLELDERPIEEIEDYTKLPGIGKEQLLLLMNFCKREIIRIREITTRSTKGLILLLQIPGLAERQLQNCIKV